MDSKTLSVLEYQKILERLASHCDFSASVKLARQLEPTTSIDLARTRQAETSEARHLFTSHEVTIGGARDIRPQVDLAARGGVLEPADLLEVKNTLIAMRTLKQTLGRISEETPRLSEIALNLPSTLGLVDAVSRTISERGEVLDSASPKLASIRSELRVSHDRLMNRLQKYLTDSKTTAMLQEVLITQRDGRYVIPLRAEFKGRIKSIIHDQSSSGATLFVEPLAVVELNNTYRELQLAERDEERRVLAELSAQVGVNAPELVTGVEALADLDLVFAKAKYAEEIDASEPVLHQLDPQRQTIDHGPSSVVQSPSSVVQAPPSIVHHPSSVVKLLHARHPLLDPKTVVPVDVDLDPKTFAVVITGPNTGGKTVTLKTVGLLVLMAQSGLHIPARSGSELSCFQAVWADIGDEQSIEQSLSTFSGHITNISRLLKKADRRSLVILDELGAGTDPQEGAALARAILAHLLGLGVTTLVATHFPELKTFAHVTPGVVNASLEFDIRTLRPTFRLTIGLPGRSNALAIAERLGLPETILEVARSEVNPDDLRADDLLDEIHRQRRLARKEREKAERARIEAHRLRRELNERLEKIEDERREVLEKARSEVEAEVSALQTEIQETRRELQKRRQPLDVLKPVIAQAEVIEEKVQQPIVPRRLKTTTVERPLRLGERVHVRTLKKDGMVTALGESEAEVQVGSLRVRARLGDLQHTSEELPAANRPQAVDLYPSSVVHAPSSMIHGPSPGMQLDLRGQLADDALDMLDRYLEQAYLSGMPFVRIIHGKGTGRLRQVVRKALKGHPHVTSFEEGDPREGGEGVTVAKLVGV